MDVDSKKTAKKCTASVVQSEMLGQRYAGPMLAAATMSSLPRPVSTARWGGLHPWDNLYERIDPNRTLALPVARIAAFSTWVGNNVQLVSDTMYSVITGYGIGNWTPELQAKINNVIYNDQISNDDKTTALKLLRQQCIFSEEATLKFDIFYLLETKFKKYQVHFEQQVQNELLKRSPNNKAMRDAMFRVAQNRILDGSNPWWVVQQDVNNKYGSPETSDSVANADLDQNKHTVYTDPTNLQLFDTEQKKDAFLGALQAGMEELTEDKYKHWSMHGHNFQTALETANEMVRDEVLQNFELAMQKGGVVMAGHYDKLQSKHACLKLFESNFDLEGLDHTQFLRINSANCEEMLQKCVQDYEDHFKTSAQIYLYEHVPYKWTKQEERGNANNERTIQADPRQPETNPGDDFVLYVNIYRDKYEILHDFWYKVYEALKVSNSLLPLTTSQKPWLYTKMQRITTDNIYDFLTSEHSEFTFKMSSMTAAENQTRKKRFENDFDFLKKIMNEDLQNDSGLAKLYHQVCGCLDILYWVDTGKLIRYQKYNDNLDDDSGKYKHVARLFEQRLLFLKIQFETWKKSNPVPAAIDSLRSALVSNRNTAVQQSFKAEFSADDYDYALDSVVKKEKSGYGNSIWRLYTATVHRGEQVMGFVGVTGASFLLAHQFYLSGTSGMTAAAATGGQFAGQVASESTTQAVKAEVTQRLKNKGKEEGLKRILQTVENMDELLWTFIGILATNATLVAQCLLRRCQKDGQFVCVDIGPLPQDDKKYNYSFYIQLQKKNFSFGNKKLLNDWWPYFKTKISNLVLLNNSLSKHVSECSFDDSNKRVCFQTNDENLKQHVKDQFNEQSFKYDVNKFVKMIFNDENDLQVQITSGWLAAIPMQKNTTSPAAMKKYDSIKLDPADPWKYIASRQQQP